MAILDLIILAVYLIAMLGVGFHFFRKDESLDDYFVGGRNLSSVHVGMSVVATDVGGGFSIGLGGLGFAMGISGSWLLFTGLLGAWLSAVVLIPKVKRLEKTKAFFTFPEVFNHYYGPNVAMLAALISLIGYVGFTSSQILAGAKLASSAFVSLDLNTALWFMGVTAVVYTALGGLKAVIYTDTIQWIILMAGLMGIGIPFSYFAVGGWDEILRVLPASFFSFTEITWQTLVNWAVTIVPIWFVAMTLFQRIYACSSEKEAKRAWLIAGLLEWPIMALTGVILGLIARVAAEKGMFVELGYASATAMDSELGLPLLLRTVLPAGLMGLVLASYFSAILSTADSCLMAASGNLVSDVIPRFSNQKNPKVSVLTLSRIATFALGAISLALASQLTNVLELMLLSYAFMVSGLFVPMIAALTLRSTSASAAMASMIGGGCLTVVLTIWAPKNLPFGLDPNIFGITFSAMIYAIVYSLDHKRKSQV